MAIESNTNVFPFFFSPHDEEGGGVWFPAGVTLETGGWVGGREKKTPERKAKMVCLEFPEEGELTDW